MAEFLSRFDPALFIGLTAVVGGLVIGLVSAVFFIVGAFWESVRKAEVKSRIVQDMLDRGMPTDEIVDVVVALGVGGSCKQRLARGRSQSDTPPFC
jgi:hypothetical protein